MEEKQVVKEESKWKCSVVDVDVEKLKFANYNPRQANKEEYNNLKKSISRFGIVDPLIVNSAENRKNVVVGGHFRLRVLKDLKIKQVPVVYVNIPDIEKEKELNLRLNKNLGSWDIDLLGNFNDELLKEVGFDLEDIFGLDKKEEFNQFDLICDECDKKFGICESIKKFRKNKNRHLFCSAECCDKYQEKEEIK